MLFSDFYTPSAESAHNTSTVRSNTFNFTGVGVTQYINKNVSLFVVARIDWRTIKPVLLLVLFAHNNLCAHH